MVEIFKRENRMFRGEWLRSPFIPPRELTIQASGICFTIDHNITLVRHSSGWLLPGGYPEEGETLDEALIREITEEACAKVIDFQYLGSVMCRELTPVINGNLPLFYQARYWALIENGPFCPEFEIVERIEIDPEEFVEKIRWPAKKLARQILEDAMYIQKKRNKIN